MQIDQISQIMQLNGVQGTSNIGSTQDQKSKVRGLDNITLQSQKLA